MERTLKLLYRVTKSVQLEMFGELKIENAI